MSSSQQQIWKGIQRRLFYGDENSSHLRPVEGLIITALHYRVKHVETHKGLKAMLLVHKEINVTKNYQENADAVLALGDTLDIVKTLPQKIFNLIITSPPYNIGKVYEKKQPLEEYLSWQKKVIIELSDKLADNGSIIWQIGNFIDSGEVYPLDIYFYPIFKSLGFKLRNRIIWHFDHGLHCKNRFSGRYETLIWFTKSDNYKFNLDSVRVPSKYPGKLHYKGPKKGLPSGNPLGKNPSDFWDKICSEIEEGIIDIPNVKSNHPEKTTHPCQFPVELIERCVLACTDENDWVLDPFGGVGSAVIAAVKNNRKGMMIEIEPEYIKIASQRLTKLKNGELKTRPIGKKIFQPTGREKISQIPKNWEDQQGVLI